MKNYNAAIMANAGVLLVALQLFFRFVVSWFVGPVLLEITDTQRYLQTIGLDTTMRYRTQCITYVSGV